LARIYIADIDPRAVARRVLEAHHPFDTTA
jgi:hypothetical protein